MSRISLIEMYMLMTKDVSLRSTCLRQQNGALITSIDFLRVLSIGYNGAPHNIQHCKGGEPGQCQCIHAETNALLKKYSPEPANLFITTSPCMECAKNILQANIENVFFLNHYRDLKPISFLEESGKKVIQVILKTQI